MSKALENRVEGLERDMLALLTAARATAQPPPKSLRTKLIDLIPTILATLLPSLVLFTIGYWFQERFKQDIEERKLGTETVKQIRDFALELLTGGMDENKARSTGLAMAAFGRYSVMPLLTVLEAGGENQILAAQNGLAAAGFIDRTYTCRVLGDVIDSRNQRYTAITFKQVVRTVADIGCKGEDGAHADRALARLDTLLSGDARQAARIFKGEDQPNAVDLVRTELNTALKRLAIQPRGS